jgi:peptidylprolyl isomerase
MSKKQRSKKSRRQSPSEDITIPLNPKVIIAVVAILAVVGVTWAVIAAQKSGTASTAEGPVPTPETKTYLSEPPMQIDVNKSYTATVKMFKGGEFTIELYPDKAPVTVNSFVFLARDHYYDYITFHRVLESFMAQTGDPTGTGSGGPGYQFVDEPNDLVFDKEGIVAMANSGPNTNGSQFFITFGPTEHLNGAHTIFGQVASGMDVVKSITLRDPDTNPDYLGDAIETITITEE